MDKQKLLFSNKADGGRGLKAKILTEGGKRKKRASEPVLPTDYSVSAEALELFRDRDVLANAILTYQDLQKLQSTYVIPYRGGQVERTTAGKTKTVNREALVVNGRIHTQFVLTGAETGRFSSRNPNLQNIPHPRTSNGKAIRNLFVAPEGCSLVVADYSQIEPRVMASFSQDPVMLDAYLTGKDIYTAIAEPLGLSRDAGKVAVLSMSYGVGPDKASSSLGISLQEAKDFLEQCEQQFKSVMDYKKQVIRTARARNPQPYVETMVGRRRYLPDLKSREFGFKSRAERQAFNTVIQGSAADLIKVAMVRAHHLLPDGAYMVLTVHDEIVTVTPDDMAEETASSIREAMEGIKALKVPLVADLTIVKKWGDAK
jgi:DNA polymerase-1